MTGFRACKIPPWDDPDFPNSIPAAKAQREKRGDLHSCMRCGADFITRSGEWYCPRCKPYLKG